MAEFILLSLAKIAVIVMGFVMVVASLLTWVERKLSALIQDRVGPNRAQIGGFKAAGVFHLIADALKMLTKEDFDPAGANPFLFKIGPWLAAVPTMLLFVVIPFGPGEHFLISGIDTGILFLFAIGSLGVYGNTIGGWASNNNFALLGAIRTSAQMISYEVAMGLSLIGVFMVYRSVGLQDIVLEQTANPLHWGVVMQPLGFVLFMTASIAETKRAPFDLPEGESEIIGYYIEYSSMRFGVFALSEFIAVVAVAAMGAALFLGGWQNPVVDWFGLTGPLAIVLQIGAMLAKVLVLVYLQMLIRWTLPRFRYDQVMDLGWKMLLPLSLLNILVTGVGLWLFEG